MEPLRSGSLPSCELGVRQDSGRLDAVSVDHCACRVRRGLQEVREAFSSLVGIEHD
jgi:hypothetical protein